MAEYINYNLLDLHIVNAIEKIKSLGKQLKRNSCWYCRIFMCRTSKLELCKTTKMIIIENEKIKYNLILYPWNVF